MSTDSRKPAELRSSPNDNPNEFVREFPEAKAFGNFCIEKDSQIAITSWTL